jgi:hypothetical protein
VPSGQFCAEYYSNRYLAGSPAFTRNESSINYDWGNLGPGVGYDNFSVRWQGRFTFSSGAYAFVARADDGMRVWLDGNPILDAWYDQPAADYRVVRTLTGGEHEIRVEYYEYVGGAVAQLRWEMPGGDGADRPGNLAVRRPAYASSQETLYSPPLNGNDGSLRTRWSSQAPAPSGQWWWTDLAGGVTFDRVIIRWETAYAARHFVGFSDDGRNYYGYWYTVSAPGDYSYRLGAHTARWVGVYMDMLAPGLGNYSFWEFEAYDSRNWLSGPQGAPAPIELAPTGGLATLVNPDRHGTQPVLGDVNGDRVVDVFDLAFISGRYGTADSAADVNQDGRVDVFDLAAVAGHYGQSPTY